MIAKISNTGVQYQPYPSRQQSAGFTLIETIVVVILISLFMILSIPLFSDVGTGNLDTSARQISGTIKYLYNEAALSGLEHRLVFDIDRGSYQALVQKDTGEWTEPLGRARKKTLADGVRFKNLRLPDRGTFSAGQVTMRILPNGWTDEVLIRVEDREGKELALHVNPLTGSAELHRGSLQD